MKTIGELIQELQKYPQDALIFDSYEEPFQKILYCEAIYLGDPANPHCKTTEGYILQ